jgi:hypothetical protein
MSQTSVFTCPQAVTLSSLKWWCRKLAQTRDQTIEQPSGCSAHFGSKWKRPSGLIIQGLNWVAGIGKERYTRIASVHVLLKMNSIWLGYTVLNATMDGSQADHAKIMLPILSQSPHLPSRVAGKACNKATCCGVYKALHRLAYP